MAIDNVQMNQALSAYDAAARMATSPLNMPEMGTEAVAGPSFSELLGTAVNRAIGTAYQSEATSTKALAGKAELHDLVTAVAAAEMTLNTVVAIRDRVVSAYQDIIRMPI